MILQCRSRGLMKGIGRRIPPRLAGTWVNRVNKDVRSLISLRTKTMNPF